MLSTDWSPVSSCSIDDAYSFIQNRILTADSLFIPIHTSKPRGHVTLPRFIRHLIHKRSFLWSHYKLSGLQSDYLLYKSMRNLCCSKIRQFHRDRQRSIVQAAVSNPKVLFKYFNSKRSCPSSSAILRDSSGSLSSPQIAAELFRDYFTSVFAASSPPPPLSTTSSISSLSSIDLSLSSVFSLLQSCNLYGSPGPDGIHPRILKEAAHELTFPFHTLFSRSLSSGSIPSIWKVAFVTARFKSGDRYNPSSYRPISLTFIPCKRLERAVKSELLQFLLKHSLISSKQHGFRPFHSCQSNLLTFFNSVTSMLDAKLSPDAIFFDFANHHHHHGQQYIKYITQCFTAIQPC